MSDQSAPTPETGEHINLDPNVYIQILEQKCADLDRSRTMIEAALKQTRAELAQAKATIDTMAKQISENERPRHNGRVTTKKGKKIHAEEAGNRES